MIGQLFNLMIQLIRLLLNPVILIPVIIYASIYTYKNRKYKKGTYHQVTKTTYFDVRRNIGRYGEYLIYKNLLVPTETCLIKGSFPIGTDSLSPNKVYSKAPFCIL